MKHLKEKWFQNSLEAAQKGGGNIYAFNSLALRERHQAFRAKGLHKLEPYDRYYEPNPFFFQHDLMIYCWVHFHQILKEEVQLLRLKAQKEQRPHFSDLADQIREEKALYGMKREDFMFGACEIRWPSNFMNGSYRGPFVRDPWMEERTIAFSHPNYKNIISFGGGGQGKTLTFMGLFLQIWDFFIYTQKGARCMISTVNKDKLNSAAWPYLLQLNASTSEGISLYAGKGKIGADHTLKREGTKDTAGVFKGILLGDRLDDSSIVDKLTGSHGHPFVGYVMDEAQSTPEAPITASSNYTMHAADHRIVLCGNYNEDTDTLGKNCMPSTGWDTVDDMTGQWMSYMVNHQPAIVLHFSNNRSPGMTETGHKQFPYLPHENILKEKYPKKETRTLENKQYRRFWVGWRIVNAEGDSVIVGSTVKSVGADQPVNMKSVLHRFMAFDSAQAEGDRNLLGFFIDGIDAATNERVWGADAFVDNLKTSDDLKYYTESSNWIVNHAKRRGIESGSLIVDWTGRPAQAEILKQMGFESVQMIYHQAVPDGKKRNPRTGRPDRPIVLNPDPRNRVEAHQVATNMISLGAWLLQQYVQSGRVRGINEQMLAMLSSSHSMEEEMFSRKFIEVPSAQYGVRVQLERKRDFRDRHGFSPDFMDLWCQAAYYMFVHRNLPYGPITTGGKESVHFELDLQQEISDHQSLWEDDLLEY